METSRSVTKLLLAAAVMVLMTGCPEPPTEYAKITIDLQKHLYMAATLGPGDIFEVKVYRQDDLSGVYKVAPQGTIDFPLVGAIYVEGNSPDQVAVLLTDKLKDGYLKNPYVTVFVKEYNSKKIFLLGQVKKPGTYNYGESMTIVQAISLAGGFTPIARSNYTIVTRMKDGMEKRIPVPVDDISQGLAKNFFIKPGDIIFVPEKIL